MNYCFLTEVVRQKKLIYSHIVYIGHLYILWDNWCKKNNNKRKSKSHLIQNLSNTYILYQRYLLYGK